VFILSNIALILVFSSMRKMGEQVRRAMLLVSALILAGFAHLPAAAGFASDLI
jgi:hypothetical protein